MTGTPDDVQAAIGLLAWDYMGYHPIGIIQLCEIPYNWEYMDYNWDEYHTIGIVLGEIPYNWEYIG